MTKRRSLGRILREYKYIHLMHMYIAQRGGEG